MKSRAAWYAGGLLAGVIVLALAIGWYLVRDDDSSMAHVKQLQQELMADREGNSTDPAARRQKFEALRTAMQSLTDDQRQSIRMAFGEQMQQRMAAKAHAFVQLAAAERTKYLDAEIDRMEKQRPPRGGGNGGPPGGFPGGMGGPGAGPGGPGGGPPPGAMRGSPNAQEQQDERRRERLDRTTPEQRAEFAVYMKALRDRRDARGLPTRGPRGF